MATTKKTVTVAAESKSTTAKSAAKPAADKKAVKTTAAKTETKPAAKKTSAAAKKTSTAAAKTTAKKTAKKNVVTIDSICAKVEKKISKTKASAIKENIALDIEVWGFEDGSKKMYIEIKDGKVTVAPFSYDAKDFRVSISVANAVAFADGKTALNDLLNSSEFYAEGNVVKAVKLAAIF